MRSDTVAELKILRESHAPAKFDSSQQQEAAERAKTEEVPKEVRRANNTRYLEYLWMVKLERKLIRMILEYPGPRPPAPPASLRGASYVAREVTAENLLAATGELRYRWKI